jgi:hypothetical protein
LLGLAMLAVACASGGSSGSGSTPSTTSTTAAVVDAQAAAENTLQSRGASIHASANNGGRSQGTIAFRERTVSLKSFPPAGIRASSYRSRFVGGWNYVQIAPGVRRPRALQPDANWIAFQDTYAGGVLPVPFSSIRGDFVFRILDAMKAGRISGARRIGPTSGETTQLLFTVPTPVAQKDVRSNIVKVSIDPEGRVIGIRWVTRFRDGSSQVSNVTLAFVDSVPSIEPPPSDRTQRLAPYEPTPTTP